MSQVSKKRVTAIGGIFFKSKDPKKLMEWYRQHLGIEIEGDWGGRFEWRELENSQRKAYTVWSVFPHTTKYFDPSPAPFMVNYRVANLDELLNALRQEGVKIDEEKRIEESEFGRFAWIMDPDGNRIELWQPPEDQ